MSECKPFPIVPGVSTCTSKCKALSLCRLPRRYPRTTTLASLRSAYTLSDAVDFDKALSIKPAAYIIPATPGLAPSKLDDYCDIDSTGDGMPFYNYIDPISDQYNEQSRTTPWILYHGSDEDEDASDDLACSAGTAGITKGPAYVSLYNTIQELLTPPTVSPAVQPGRKAKIPKPDGECTDGTWTLTWGENGLEWVCSGTESGDCTALEISNIRILDGDGNEIVSNITSYDVSLCPNPAITFDWKYSGYSMPQIPITVTLDTTVLKNDDDSLGRGILSVSWANSSTKSNTVYIGPISYSGEKDPTKPPEPITGSISPIPFIWSATECYVENQESQGLSDTKLICTASPVCRNSGNKAATKEVTVSCDSADGELSLESFQLLDEYGEPLPTYPNHEYEHVIGLRCDEYRQGVFFADVVFVNNTNSVYVNDGKIKPIAVADAAVANGEDKVFSLLRATSDMIPDHLPPLAKFSGLYKIEYQLLPQVCAGDIRFLFPPTKDAAVFVLINADCKECPSFMLDGDVIIAEQGSGESIDALYVGCVQTTVTKVVDVTLMVKPSVTGEAYNNKANEKIVISCTSDNEDGLGILGSNELSVVVPNIPANSTAKVSFSFTLEVRSALAATDSSENPAGSFTFAITTIPDDSGVVGSKSLAVLKYCGSLRPLDGLTIINVDTESEISSIDDCTGGPWNLGLLQWIKNTSKEAPYVGDVTITWKASKSGAVSITGTASYTETQHITIAADGAVAVQAPKPWFKVAGDVSNIKPGSVTFSCSIVEHDVKTSKVLNINKDCTGSSGECTDGECCPYVESGDSAIVIGFNKNTGKCTIGLKSKILTEDDIKTIIADWIEANSRTC